MKGPLPLSALTFTVGHSQCSTVYTTFCKYKNLVRYDIVNCWNQGWFTLLHHYIVEAKNLVISIIAIWISNKDHCSYSFYSSFIFEKIPNITAFQTSYLLQRGKYLRILMTNVHKVIVIQRNCFPTPIMPPILVRRVRDSMFSKERVSCTSLSKFINNPYLSPRQSYPIFSVLYLR